MIVKKIVILGTGKSSRHLIDYWYKNSEANMAMVIVGDIDTTDTQARFPESNHFKYFRFEVGDYDVIESQIEGATITISMLPPSLHTTIAKICIQHKCHLITPSYISDDLKALDSDAQNNKCTILCELGFDPGIDHLITMKTVNKYSDQGYQLTSYKSYAGGLVASESDDNPWNYKFSWNPTNVIRAGQGGVAKYIENGNVKYVPPHSIFSYPKTVVTPNGFSFEAYPNRDSVKYMQLYQWPNITNLYRGTLRRLNFCKAWDVLIKLGLTDTSFELNLAENSKLFDFYSRFYSYTSNETAQSELLNLLKADADLTRKLEYIGFWDNYSVLPKTKGTPADILQSILEIKWELKKTDKDFVAMVNYYEFEKNNEKIEVICYYTADGEDNYYTAMSKLVGLPIALASQLLLTGGINQHGVILPFAPEIYNPILQQLEELGITFEEEKFSIK